MSFQRQALRSRAFQWAVRLSNRLQLLPNRLAPAPFRLMQIGSAFWQSRVLYVAARLDLATTVADQRLSVTDLSSQLGVDEDALHRLMRMLSAMGIFEIGRDGRVANNALSQPLRTDNPMCVRNMVLMHNSPELSRPWYETLEQGVREGKIPFALFHGFDLYSYRDAHPEFEALFSRAMEEVEFLGGDGFAVAFDCRASQG